MAGHYEKIVNVLSDVKKDCKDCCCNTYGCCPHLELCRRIVAVQTSARALNIEKEYMGDTDNSDIKDFADAIARLISYIDEQKGDNA